MIINMITMVIATVAACGEPVRISSSAMWNHLTDDDKP